MKTSTYLPLPGAISRKRRRKWRRQILRLHPGLNPAWLDARYEIAFECGGRRWRPSTSAEWFLLTGDALPVRLDEHGTSIVFKRSAQVEGNPNLPNPAWVTEKA